MTIPKASKRLIALLVLTSSFFLASNLRASGSGWQVELGSPAQAQRGRLAGRVMLAVLALVVDSVISSGTEAAMAGILDDGEYVGSYYSATFYSSQHGRTVTWHFFHDSSGIWYGYFPSNNQWQPVNAPSVTVSHTADVYQRRSGEFYWTNP